ncbi:Sec-independent protein translocase protein TatB [Nitrosophilus kaiyonis]|uniref:Sec-independent protein translocase protein TatB n=1 Tax=Nitrosophilus kaiyonis TaxID=2930200 RepID=UPI002492910D|nr:Sec-independent protein translocase protein TatB [Nitrosophilus kaiyonis]
MFGMGFTEILMIAIVAIIFLGPEKLPKFLVDVAKFFKSVKRAVNDAKNSLEEEIKISELKEEALEYKKKLGSVSKEVESITHLSDLEDEIQEVKEIEKEIKKEPKREVVKFKKKNIDEDKDKVDV